MFEEKLYDVVAMYLSPSEHAIVLSVDEKSKIQSLNRTQRSLAVFPGRLQTMTHDYKRNGTTTLFAAMNVADGTVLADLNPRHRHRVWLDFLKTIGETFPGVELHIICDNYATHKHERVRKRLARRARFHIHFTPTSRSWLNLVERWYRDLTAGVSAGDRSKALSNSNLRSGNTSTRPTTHRSHSPGTPTRMTSSQKSAGHEQH